MTRPFAVLVLLGAATTVVADEPKQPLNVLFLMSDDLRPELGGYGVTGVQSPNIDALARDGVRFERAYCQYPLCNPSRTSLLTGRHPTTTGVLDNTTHFRQAHPDWVTLPQYFKQNGYAALTCGKIYHGGLDDPQSWTIGAGTANLEGRPPNPVDRATRARRSDRWVVLEGDGESHGDYRTAERAIALLNEYKDEPFFLACGFTKPHSPPTAPRRFYDLYDPEAIPLPSTFRPLPAAPRGFPTASITPNGDLFIQREATPEEARRMIQAYHASTSWMDWNVGRVVAELDRLGLRDNTVIVFWGDHGYHLGEFGKWAKHGSLFELGARVPLIIVAPGAKGNGTSCPRPVQTLDLYPTLAALCGLEPPEGVEGLSLAPLLDDPNAAWDQPAYTVAGNPQNLGVAVRIERYRYAEWNGGENGAMLIDAQNDPDETTNLVDDPAYAAIRDQLSALVRAHAQGVSQPTAPAP